MNTLGSASTLIRIYISFTLKSDEVLIDHIRQRDWQISPLSDFGQHLLLPLIDFQNSISSTLSVCLTTPRLAFRTSLASERVLGSAAISSTAF